MHDYYVQVWFLEHSTLRAPAYPNKLPRLLKWYDSQVKTKIVELTNLKPHELVNKNIFSL